MRICVIIFAALLVCTEAGAKTTKKPPCNSLTGDATDATAKQVNRLKNRSKPPSQSDIDPNITIKRMLAPGNDVNRFAPTKAASITGYVVSAKPGGIETCNCHAEEDLKKDTHIDVVADPKYAVPKFVNVTTIDKKGKRHVIKKDTNQKYHVIVEVTPRVRRQMKSAGRDWSTKTLHKTLPGHWVTFTGWLLFDVEHWPQAENTKPGNSLNWRATCNEIHPVFGIQIVK